MANPQLTSQQWREKGKTFYTCYQDNAVGNTIKQFRLEEAMKCYNKAMSGARNSEETASACKNLAMTAWRLAELNRTDDQDKFVWAMIECATSWTKAYAYGQDCKNSDWMNGVQMKSIEHFESALNFIEHALSADGHYAHYRALTKMAEQSPSDIHTVQCHLILARKYYHLGVKCSEDGAYKDCRYYMDESKMPLAQAESLIKTGYSITDKEKLLGEINVSREELETLHCIAESRLACQTGDDLLEKLLRFEESLNMDLAWEVADWYRKAIIGARENDIEGEAIANSRMGVFFDTVIKLKGSAKTFFKRCLDLATSMAPRNVTNLQWHSVAVSTLKRYQDEAIVNDPEAQHNDHKKLLQEMKEEMENLDKLQKYIDMHDLPTFVEKLYEAFPPKKPGCKLNTELLNRSKELYRKAIVHYHPDGQPDTGGPKWKALCSEITKKLTSVYETLKGE